MEVVQRLKTFKHCIVESPLTKVTVEYDYDREATEDPFQGSFCVSHRKDTSIKLIFEETSTPDVNKNIYMIWIQTLILMNNQLYHSLSRQNSHHLRFHITSPICRWAKHETSMQSYLIRK